MLPDPLVNLMYLNAGLLCACMVSLTIVVVIWALDRIIGATRGALTLAEWHGAWKREQRTLAAAKQSTEFVSIDEK